MPNCRFFDIMSKNPANLRCCAKEKTHETILAFSINGFKILGILSSPPIMITKLVVEKQRYPLLCLKSVDTWLPGYLDTMIIIQPKMSQSSGYVDIQIHVHPNLTWKVSKQWILGYADTLIFYPKLI